MSLMFKLTTPVNVGDLTNPRAVTALQITGVFWTSTPQLAPTGTGVLRVLLTDPVSGWQETIEYTDAKPIDFWASALPATLDSGATVGSMFERAVFERLIADGKLPAGTLTTVAEASTTTTSGDNTTASTT